MRSFPLRPAAALLCCVLALPLAAQAAGDALRDAVLLGYGNYVDANQVYATASGTDLKLDVYGPRSTARVPVLINFHGGGWVAGNRESGSLAVALPYLQMGFAVVNVQYRLAKTALAPAAVEDALCALQWVGRNADKYHFDVSKVVVAGNSAGGHLALATGMIPADSPFTNQCAANEPAWSGPYANAAPKVAAVINWYGITDVADMLQGPNVRSYAVQWFGSMGNRMELARQVSPISYVRASGPAVLTIHGDADPLVPYTHALRLRDAMNKAGEKNELLTVKGGGHGGFSADQQVQAYEAIRGFLGGLGIVPQQR
jgi:acetyl esterase/lipase